MSRRASKPLSPVVSVILAVNDDEDVVGYRVRALCDHFRGKQLPFEILAVNAGSRDNSFAVLALLAQQEPALRLLPQAGQGKAFLRGAAEARGDALVLMDAQSSASLAPLGWALGRLEKGRDAILVRGRCVVARRLAVLPVLVHVPSPGPFFERFFERYGQTLGLVIVGSRPRLESHPGGRLLRPLLRLLAA